MICDSNFLYVGIIDFHSYLTMINWGRVEEMIYQLKL